MQTLRRPRTPGAVRRPLLSALLCTALAACSSDDDSGGGAVVPPDDGGSSNDSTVALFTRVSNPGSRNFYLHLLEEMPSGGVLDYSRAFEFGEAFMSVDSGFVYISDREAMSITKYAVTDERGIEELGTVSLQGARRAVHRCLLGGARSALRRGHLQRSGGALGPRDDGDHRQHAGATRVPVPGEPAGLPVVLGRRSRPTGAPTSTGPGRTSRRRRPSWKAPSPPFPLDDAPVFSNFVFDEDYRLDLLETLDARDSVPLPRQPRRQRDRGRRGPGGGAERGLPVDGAGAVR